MAAFHHGGRHAVGTSAMILGKIRRSIEYQVFFLGLVSGIFRFCFSYREITIGQPFSSFRLFFVDFRKFTYFLELVKMKYFWSVSTSLQFDSCLLFFIHVTDKYYFCSEIKFMFSDFCVAMSVKRCWVPTAGH